MKRFLKSKDRYLAIDSIESAYIDSINNWTLAEVDEEYTLHDYCAVVTTSDGRHHIVSAGSEDFCRTSLENLMRSLGEVTAI